MASAEPYEMPRRFHSSMPSATRMSARSAAFCGVLYPARSTPSSRRRSRQVRMESSMRLPSTAGSSVVENASQMASLVSVQSRFGVE